jgi:cadmium resistance protein CadD (predicted permease)
MELFGTTVNETKKGISSRDKHEYHQTLFRIIVSLILLGLGVFLIIEEKEYGQILIGIVCGYWFK